MRELLRATFDRTLAALRERVDELSSRCAGAAVRHAEHGGDVLVIAFGKAARAMATALLANLPAARVRGLCVPPAPDTAPLPPLEVIPGGHPLPTAGSFAAAAHALELCRAATVRDHVLFLVSGGGSALLELPLDPVVTVDEWRTFYQALVASGAPIGHVNRIRRRLSAIKGGRLAFAAQHARNQTTIVVKDVPGPIEDVASGPTAALPPGPDTLHADLETHGLLPALPATLRERLVAGALPPLPLLPKRVTAAASLVTVADEHFVRDRATSKLREAGVTVDAGVDADDLPIDRALDLLLARLDALRARHPRRTVAIVTTGELSVPLPPNAGTGGRNQQFALAAARRIAGSATSVLSCGTDGIDGNSPAAGAVVDGTTLARAAAAGLDVDDHLARCDAHPLLAALGDAVATGPTGTNVRDLRILLHSG